MSLRFSHQRGVLLDHAYPAPKPVSSDWLDARRIEWARESMKLRQMGHFVLARVYERDAQAARLALIDFSMNPQQAVRAMLAASYESVLGERADV